MRFIIGIDGGGTKTVGRLQTLKQEAGVVEIEKIVGGSSLSADLTLANEVISNLIYQLIETAASSLNSDSVEILKNTSIVAGLAGAGNATLAAKCQQHIVTTFGITNVKIVEDCQSALEGACHALANSEQQNNTVGLISLGTGSFIAKRSFPERKDSFIGGWGFPIGDDCSGAKLGFSCVQQFLQSVDQELWQAHDQQTENADPLIIKLKRHIGEQKTDILNWLLSASQQDFASLAPLIFEEAKMGSKMAESLISSLISQLKTLKEQYFTISDHVFISGSIAKALSNYDASFANSRITYIAEPSLEGSLCLAEYALPQESVATPHTDVLDEGHNNTELGRLTSEQRRLSTMNLDMATSLDVANLMHEHNCEIPAAIRPLLPEIAAAIDSIVSSFNLGGRLIYIGAGTSGRLGVLDAVECPPTFNTDPQQIIGLIAGGGSAMYLAVEGAEDNAELAETDLKQLNLTEYDCVVGIAASGRTPYVIGGLEYANRIGAQTIAVTNNANSKIGAIANTSIAAVVGPEVLSGSTRLAAGTAQKMILNMLSTGALVQLGKCYENLMVDVSVTNEKLYKRAVGIVQKACYCSLELAEATLKTSNNNVKTAILMIKSNLSLDAAEAMLSNQKGNLRNALTSVNTSR